MEKDHPDTMDNIISATADQKKTEYRRKVMISLSMAAIVFGLSHNLTGVAYKSPTPGLIELSVKPLALPVSQEPVKASSALPDNRLQMSRLKIPDWEPLALNEGETLAGLFVRPGLDPRLVMPVAIANRPPYPANKLHPGDKLEILKGADNRLEKVRLHISPAGIPILQAEGEGYRAKVDEKPLETWRMRTVVNIQHSLFEDGHRADLNDSTIQAAAEMFRYDVDFARDLHPGASLTLIHDTRYEGTRKVSDGHILAAELNVNGKHYRLMRFEYPDGRVKYVDPTGKPTERGFIRTPVAFTRISSTFSERFHPILGRWLEHKGVDYAAPLGTPVVATANSTVVTAGQDAGYGNLIVLRYDKHISMAYGHLSRFAKGIRPGVKVRLGQVIGYVGQTGLATGPHLHYEFRLNGVAHDPLKVALPDANYLPAPDRARYRSQAAEYLALLHGNAGIQIALR